jgi:hypothetical protein
MRQKLGPMRFQSILRLVRFVPRDCSLARLLGGCPILFAFFGWDSTNYLTDTPHRDDGRGESRWCRHLGKLKKTR